MRSHEMRNRGGPPADRSRCSAAILLMFVTMLQACGSEPQAEATYTVRDSAGIRIVESTGTAWGPGDGWEVSGEPVLHIGVVEGPEEYRFTVISGPSNHGGVWQQSEGAIVAADGGTRQMRRYASDGAFMNSWGGRGQGPGEFQSLAAFPYRGDSIVAADAGGRYVLYDGGGRLGRTLTVNLTEADPSGERPIPVASTSFHWAFSDGTFLAVRFPFAVFRPGQTVSNETTFFQFTADGEMADTIGVFRTPDIVFPEIGAPLSSFPFSQEFAFAADGETVYVGSVDGFEVLRVSIADGSESLIRATHVDLTTTEAHRAGYRDNVRAVAALNNGDLQGLERALLEVVYPEAVPAFSQVLPDSEGNLWVRHYKQRWSEGPETWSVFAPEGYLLGTVDTPERLQVRQIGPDFIVGVWTDELDVRFLRKYALSR